MGQSLDFSMGNMSLLETTPDAMSVMHPEDRKESLHP